MQSKSHAFSACGILIVLAGCYAVPANTDFQMTLAGNYKNIADCAFLDFRKEGGWIKTDYDTLNKSEFAFGNAETTGGRIDIIGIDAHHTRIDSFFPQAIWGKDYWPKRHRPIFTRCAAK